MCLKKQTSSNAGDSSIMLVFSRSIYRHENCKIAQVSYFVHFTQLYIFKEARSVTMNIFRKKYFLFKSFVKIELSYIFTVNMVSTAVNCKEK